jgi:hypothetical protein
MAQRKRPVAGKKKVDGKKVFLITLGLGVLGGGAYLVTKKYLLKPKTDDSQPEGDTSTYMLPASSGKISAGRNDKFPLKKGSKGNRVTLLQKALQKILGEEVFSQYTPIDGDFGSKTAAALTRAGFSVVVDETTYNKILNSGPKPVATLPAADDLASKLLTYAGNKDLSAVLSILTQLRSTADYSDLNEKFKAKQWYRVSASIVTYLLNESFKDNEAAKEQIKAEFLRMGLKENDGKWALSGIRLYKDLVTLVNTFVIDKAQHRIMVKRNTVLGEEIAVANGMTYFKDIKQDIHSVPTRDVAYAR